MISEGRVGAVRATFEADHPWAAGLAHGRYWAAFWTWHELQWPSRRALTEQALGVHFDG